jgi:hypothetical protein
MNYKLKINCMQLLVVLVLALGGSSGAVCPHHISLRTQRCILLTIREGQESRPNTNSHRSWSDVFLRKTPGTDLTIEKYTAYVHATIGTYL